MNNEVSTAECACEGIQIMKICWDDLDRQVLQPTETLAVGTDETADGEAQAQELFSSVTTNKPRASRENDYRNGIPLSLTLPIYSSILKKNSTSKKAC